jgi:hypothetical protein
MTIKVAVLKSGEDIIADIQEMVVGEDTENQRVIGYFFNKPCSVSFKRNKKDSTFDIGLFPWIPITKTTKVPVDPTWVVTLVDPIDQLETMYKKDILNKENDQTTSIAEQSDSDISD